MPDYSGDVLGVTYSSLNDAASAIKLQAHRLQQDLDEIKALVGRAAVNWHGEAHEAFATKQKDWDIRAHAVQTSLKQIADAVTQAAPTYQAGDRKAASHFQ
ncbi:WXG100 family type VII secretion target [Streptomyces sp. NBC_00083]|uniref:WXG100 family type VII secretion target n=1 Tax=Streptomyces sp. NBC_00083 TaxID=2975647 RepID=UPI00225003C4|nr:WXG100 family type VII secretion target [Streptomyces sp. NBC_00083]MCX5386045.1 WXG100 family type VII secretion target [Streptomyces sp. NBC_00083]